MKNPLKRIKELQIKSSIYKVKEEIFKQEYRKYFSASSYIPFAGWLIPLYLKKEEKSCQYHAKQGLLMAVFFTWLILFISVADVFMPKEWRVFRLGLALLIYLLYLTYLALIVTGVINALKEREISLPIFSKYISKLKL